MLVVGRKEGQSIRIGDDVTVVVTRIAGNRVSIGIAAPPHVQIARTELLEETDGHDAESATND